MFRAIFSYEVNHLYKQPQVYLYFLTFFSLAFISFAGTAGFFDEGANNQGVQELINSPYEINYMLNYFNKLYLFLLPAIVGTTLYRDYQTKAHMILYSYPIKKVDYILGKFLSSLSIVFFVSLSGGVGILLAELLPGLSLEKVGPTHPITFIQYYLLFVFPNLLFYGLLVFASILYYRNLLAGFVTIMLLIILQFLLENILATNQYLIALTDPFGQNTVKYLTRYWTLTERNTLSIPVHPLLIVNRLLWSCLSLVIFHRAYRWFSFRESNKVNRTKLGLQKPLNKHKSVALDDIALVKYNFNLRNQINICFQMSRFDTKYIMTSKMFMILVISALIVAIAMFLKVTQRADVIYLPVTHLILSIPAFFYVHIVLLITFIYSGMLVHRDSSVGIRPLTDISPIPNWVITISKTWSILKMQILVLTVLMITGIVFQAMQGYFHFQIKLYIFHLLVCYFLPLAIWAFASVFIHSLVQHVYAGIFILLLTWIAIGGLAQAGFTSPLVLFNSNDPVTYSDLNGYGIQLPPYLYVKLYWLLAVSLLLIIANQVWPRGITNSITERLVLAQNKLQKPVVWTALFLIMCLVYMALDIHRKQQELTVFSKNHLARAAISLEKQFAKYADLQQPKIKHLSVNLDFYPSQNNFVAEGHYLLVNESHNQIDTLIIKTGFDEITQFEFDRSHQIILADTINHAFVVKLGSTMSGGDSLKMRFFIKNQSNTFFGRNSNVLQNGSFIRADVFPRFTCMLPADEKIMQDSSIRRNYQSPDADLITFDAVVSTSKDQIALAPGQLIKTWQKGGRKFFAYKSESAIKYAFSFHSGQYQETIKKWNNVELKVYNLPAHSTSLSAMISGMQAALEYNSYWFSPYQHSSAVIIEFPNSEGSFATSFANLIPMSEVRFISKVNIDGSKINLPFYIPAHELTHQWWGNQVMPAYGAGALMLTESITEYISLCIYEKTFGEGPSLKFLQHQLQRYLTGRASTVESESPLIQVKSDQSYLAYGKGSMAFHTLAHYIGEDTLNNALKKFLDDYPASNGLFPTASKLLDKIASYTPTAFKYLIEDYFKKVVFHTGKIQYASKSKIIDHQYQVKLGLHFSKENEDHKPEEISDFIEIGCYDQQGKLFFTHRAFINKSSSEIQFFLTQNPYSITLDPNLLLIEKNHEDNIWSF